MAMEGRFGALVTIDFFLAVLNTWRPKQFDKDISSFLRTLLVIIIINQLAQMRNLHNLLSEDTAFSFRNQA